MKKETIEKLARLLIKDRFTQGPWTSEDCTLGESAGLCYAIKSEHTVIARTTDGWKEARANARLIASAPAMHEVLTGLLDTLEVSRGYGFDEEYENVREVLAKADGAEA